MNNEAKEELFNKLATAVDAYAWVAANTLKEKFGVVDDEEEYKKIEQDVVDYVESDEFKEKVKAAEISILDDIATVALTGLQELRHGDNEK
jgi:hypothetical protein